MTLENQIPTENTVEELAALVRIDLVERGTVPNGDHVVYSHGEPGKRTTPGQNQMPMVWFWLDDTFNVDVGQMGDPTSIEMYATLDGQTVTAGQSIMVERTRARVEVQARVQEEVPPEDATPPRRGRTSSVSSEKAGTQLRRRVLAAIWRAMNGSFKVLAGKIFSPTGSEFTHGAGSQFIIELYHHMSNDANPYDPADALGQQTYDDEPVAEIPTSPEEP